MGQPGPFGILADHERARRPSDWRLWEKWLHVAKGRRTLEWSRGLRAQVLPDERERTDDELAEESDPAEEVVAAPGPQVWRALAAHGLTVAALAAAEERGLGGLVVLLRAAGLPVEARGRDGPWLLTLAGEDEWPPHWEAEA